MDDDLEQMSRDELVVEVKRLRAGIRTHRDSSGMELCWYHPDLWSLVPDDGQDQGAGRVEPVVPEWPQFIRGCVQYRSSLDVQLPAAPRSTDEYQP